VTVVILILHIHTTVACLERCLCATSQLVQTFKIVSVVRKMSSQIQNKSIENIDQFDFNQFYSQRVESFEKERVAFDHYLALIEPHKESTHQLLWYNRKLLEEVRVAQVEKELLEKKISQAMQ